MKPYATKCYNPEAQDDVCHRVLDALAVTVRSLSLCAVIAGLAVLVPLAGWSTNLEGTIKCVVIVINASFVTVLSQTYVDSRCQPLFTREKAAHIEPSDLIVQSPQLLSPPNNRVQCQVCGDAIAPGDFVFCSNCLTPHHQDCFLYNQKCSTYGCGCPRARRPLGRAS